MRLRLMGLMGCAIYACFTVTSAIPIFRDVAVFLDNWFYYPVFWSAFLVFADAANEPAAPSDIRANTSCCARAVMASWH
jgi:hypothetical protein